MTQTPEITPGSMAGIGAAIENSEFCAHFDQYPTVPTFSAGLHADHAFNTVLHALLIRGGCTLSSDIRNKLLQRIRQRMIIRGIERIEEYCRLLECDSDEDGALFNGLLNGTAPKSCSEFFEPIADEWYGVGCETPAGKKALNPGLPIEISAAHKNGAWDTCKFPCLECMTLCLDAGMRIVWFSPAVSPLLDLKLTDIGRSIREVSFPGLEGDLVSEVEWVLQNAMPSYMEIGNETTGYYLRKVDINRESIHEGIDRGVVIIFTNITSSHQRWQALLDARTAMNDQLEQRVQERTMQLRTLMTEVAMAEEREQRILAQELNNNLGQLLAIAKIKLTALEMHLPNESIKSTLTEILVFIDQAIHSARSMANQLNPPALAECGLPSAIEWLAEDMGKRYGLSVVIEDDNEPKPLDLPMRSILFRALRELLMNVVKHANTNRANIHFRRQDPYMTITVSDEGTGFDPGGEAVDKGYGIRTIKERLDYLGGALTVSGALGLGVIATLRVPLASTMREEG